MLWFSKKNKDDPVLKSMDGREIKYVTRMGKDENGNPTSLIVGKKGRIVCIEGEIRVLCGEIDVFRCMAKDAEYYLHLSGDGVTVKGENSVTGEYDHIMIFYTYYRK